MVGKSKIEVSFLSTLLAIGVPRHEVPHTSFAEAKAIFA
jgi:hypothetical protein